MSFDMKILGCIIRRLRQKRGLSQEVLSGLAGIARTHLTMIEIGSKQPNIETVWRIAQALDMQASDIISLAEQEMQDRK